MHLVLTPNRQGYTYITDANHGSGTILVIGTRPQSYNKQLSETIMSNARRILLYVHKKRDHLVTVARNKVNQQIFFFLPFSKSICGDTGTIVACYLCHSLETILHTIYVLSLRSVTRCRNGAAKTINCSADVKRCDRRNNDADGYREILWIIKDFSTLNTTSHIAPWSMNSNNVI